MGAETHNEQPNSTPKSNNVLPELLLTRRNIRELNRRNGLTPTTPPPTNDYGTLPTLIRFARQGGPDLTDLRGVSHSTAVARYRSSHLFSGRIP